MNTIAIIPARAGSKGLLRKNLAMLEGMPLIARPIQHLLSSQVETKIFVSTDCPDIQATAIQHGADCPFLRPTSLALDHTTTEETLKHALSQAELYYSLVFDLCIFLTATDVYRDPAWILECHSKMVSSPDLDSVFVGYKTTKNYWEQTDAGNWLRIRPWMSIYGSRQTRRFIVREDTGVCCVSRSHLWREGRRVGDNVHIFVKDHTLGGLDIHTQYDLDFANYALEAYD